MTELSGILDGVGLPAITRFLAGLRKTGRLDVTDRDWHGQIYFHEGRIAAARLGSRSGVDALEAIVEVLPAAQFAFDSHAPADEQPAMHLSQDELLERMDAIAGRVATGARHLASPDVVPTLVPESAGGGDEPVPLDRGTLQTLLAVDGQRSVRDIVNQRNSFDALWQLAQLAEVGLIDLGPAYRRLQTPSETKSVMAPPPPTRIEVAAAPAEVTRVAAAPPEGEVVRCPRLGFEDDAASSFARPTRLHRCFAANTPLPLSLDQQRELCLTDQFGTCPRLAQVRPESAVQAAAASTPPAPPAASAGPAGRIVQLPTAARQPVGERAERAEASAPTVSNGPRPLRAAAAVRANAAAGAESPAEARPTPTPLRARLQRAPAPATATAVAEPLPGLKRERRIPAEVPTNQPEPTASAESVSRVAGASPLAKIPPSRMIVMLGLGLGVVLIAALAYFVAPQVTALFSADSVDTASLPNARLVEEGTPVSQLAVSRATVAPRAPAAQPAAGASSAQPTAATQPSTAGATSAQPTAAPAQAAQAAPAQAAGASSAQPTPVAAPAAARSAPPSAPLFDERFSSNDANWPSDPQGAALFTNGIYRIATRQAGQFAAIAAPIANVPADVVIGATFRKLAGPPGGGYGIIVRNQDAGSLDGTNQNGHYYVLEAGDKGEIGIWRRDGDHWVDILPWQHSDAVKTGNATNDLAVRAVGSSFSLIVNGATVATRTDPTFSTGTAGLFVGGDGNQVAVTHFAIDNP